EWLAGPLDPELLREQTGLTKTKLTTILTRLEEQGAVRVLPDGEVEPTERSPDAAAVVRAQDGRREYERSRVRMVQEYAELRDCRRRFLLNYFGELREEPCGFCDNCD